MVNNIGNEEKSISEEDNLMIDGENKNVDQLAIAEDNTDNGETKDKDTEYSEKKEPEETEDDYKLQPLFVCCCNASFQYLGQITSHKKKSCDWIYVCPHCDRVYKDFDKMTAHKLTHQHPPTPTEPTTKLTEEGLNNENNDQEIKEEPSDKATTDKNKIAQDQKKVIKPLSSMVKDIPKPPVRNWSYQNKPGNMMTNRPNFMPNQGMMNQPNFMGGYNPMMIGNMGMGNFGHMNPMGFTGFNQGNFIQNQGGFFPGNMGMMGCGMNMGPNMGNFGPNMAGNFGPTMASNFGPGQNMGGNYGPNMGAPGNFGMNFHHNQTGIGNISKEVSNFAKLVQEKQFHDTSPERDGSDNVPKKSRSRSPVVKKLERSDSPRRSKDHDSMKRERDDYHGSYFSDGAKDKFCTRMEPTADRDRSKYDRFTPGDREERYSSSDRYPSSRDRYERYGPPDDRVGDRGDRYSAGDRSDSFKPTGRDYSPPREDRYGDPPQWARRPLTRDEFFSKSSQGMYSNSSFSGLTKREGTETMSNHPSKMMRSEPRF